MGAKQSLPKITAQDKAILEYDFFPWFMPRASSRMPYIPFLIFSLKLQRDKLRQYQKTVRCKSFFKRDDIQGLPGGNRYNMYWNVSIQ